MNLWLAYLIALLLWPGLIGATLLGWLYMWFIRKLSARFQGRQGPPFYQPFFDFIKLLGKENIVPAGINRALYYGLPILSLVSIVFALALIPVPGNPIQSFPGDLIVFIYLLETPALCEILAGFSTRSPYGQVGASREAMMSLGYNVPFLAAVIAVAVHAGSYNLNVLAKTPLSWVSLAAAVAFFLSLPARLKSNPFSIANAEQEVVAGAHTEYSGIALALFELSHTLELVAMISLFAVLFLSPITSGWVTGVAYLLLSVLLIVLITLIGNATARLKLNQAFRFYWRWGAAAAVVAIVFAFIF
jgi:NADH-quinone oxidoreductase subunit H